MAYKIKLFGDFTYEMLRGWLYSDDDSIITSDLLEQELQNAAGEDLEVDLSSVGGYADVATDMIILLRDYKREFKNAEMILNIKGMAASAASFFAAAEVWDLITVEDISTWMGHRPFACICGDYEVFESEAESLRRATELYASVYAKRSGKTTNNMLELMRKTTYLYGQEIIDNGFADEIMKTDNDIDKDSAIAQMENKQKLVMKKMRETEHKNEKEYLEKVAASLNRFEKRHNFSQQSSQPAEGGKNKNQEESIMNLDELKQKHPDIHAETMKAGRDEGVDAERTRVQQLIEMKNRDDFKGVDIIMQRIDEGIKNGDSLQMVENGIGALLLKNNVQSQLESPKDINPGGQTTMSGEPAKTEEKARW